jgi:nucleotide-binding universal stress UspA family protein
MEPTNKLIIVPWDFTLVAEYALQHAVKYAHILKTRIILLHIVKKEEDVPGIKKQLELTAKENETSHGIPTEALVKQGSIFTTITEVADSFDAEMVIMGTHGIKGMQKYLGSWALKVIANTNVPFMVIQDAPQKGKVEKILFPINFRKENKETLYWIIQLSKLFEIKVVMFAARYTDRKLKKDVSSNILFAQKLLDKRKVPHELVWSSTKGDFPQLVVEYAIEMKPDIIVIMTTRDVWLTDFLMGVNEQYIIANSEKIPVLCLNPRPLKNIGGFMAGGG